MPDPRTLYQKATQFFKANQFEKAIEFLEQAITLAPNDVHVIEALGVIFGRLDRIDEAILLMKKLAQLDPDGIMAHTNLSQFYARKGMIDEAEHEQAEARRLSWKAELRGKKMSESEIEKISVEDAQAEQAAIARKIEQYKKIIEYDPKDVLGYFTLGTAYLQGKCYEDASKTLRQAIEVNPDHSPSYVGLGEALEALNRNDEALQIYQKGIPVADRKGDIIPLRKMESRVRKLM